jgi:hypothetical protein
MMRLQRELRRNMGCDNCGKFSTITVSTLQRELRRNMGCDGMRC